MNWQWVTHEWGVLFLGILIGFLISAMVHRWKS